MVISAIYFAEKFRGKLDRLYDRLGELGRKKKAAEDAYMEGDYYAALDEMRAIRDDY